MGGSGSRPLIRLKSNFGLGLQSSESLNRTGRSAFKLTHITVGRKPKFFTTCHDMVVVSPEKVISGREREKEATVPFMTYCHFHYCVY